MSIDRIVMAFAGAMILASLALSFIFESLVAAARRLCRAQSLPGRFHRILSARDRF